MFGREDGEVEAQCRRSCYPLCRYGAWNSRKLVERGGFDHVWVTTFLQFQLGRDVVLYLCWFEMALSLMPTKPGPEMTHADKNQAH